MKIINEQASKAVADLRRNQKAGRAKVEELDPKDKPAEGQELKESEKVSVSQTSQEIERLRSLTAALPEVRTEKVERLKAEISQGTYRIPTDQIAEKLLEEFR